MCGTVVVVMTRYSVVMGGGYPKLAIDATVVSSAKPSGACATKIWVEACPCSADVCVPLGSWA